MRKIPAEGVHRTRAVRWGVRGLANQVESHCTDRGRSCNTSFALFLPCHRIGGKSTAPHPTPFTSVPASEGSSSAGRLAAGSAAAGEPTRDRCRRESSNAAGTRTTWPRGCTTSSTLPAAPASRTGMNTAARSSRLAIRFVRAPSDPVVPCRPPPGDRPRPLLVSSDRRRHSTVAPPRRTPEHSSRSSAGAATRPASTPPSPSHPLRQFREQRFRGFPLV